MNKFIIVTIFSTTLTINTMQRAIIHPFFSTEAAIVTLKKQMDKIERKNLGYPDYSKRTGLIWTDFFVNKEDPDIMKLRECKETVKLTEVNGKLQRHYPESMFDYPKVQAIVAQQILPKMFEIIERSGWAQLPPEFFAQLFIQRCHTSDAMDWHQDPGEDFTAMADYSLLLMLSDQNDHEHGWEGGELKIKAGLPTQECAYDEIQTIIPLYNQAILFNNKVNSHMVTAVTTQLLQTKRDLLVIPLYFEAIPMPVEQKW